MMRRLMFLFVVLIVAAGCSETSEPKVLPFSLDLKVTDPVGDPVPDLEVRLYVQVPGATPLAAKAISKVQFMVPTTSQVAVTVYDLEGGLVKRLVDGVALAGRHEVAFFTDEQGQALVGTHIYRCEMVASVDSVEVFRDSIHMTLHTSFNFDQRPILGLTDSNGQLTFTDRTEFPFLYELGPQPRINENAEQQGTVEISSTVIITLVDPDTGVRQNREVVVGAGPNRATLVWDPVLAVAAIPPAAKPDPAARRQPPDTLADYSLGPNYPNPFN